MKKQKRNKQNRELDPDFPVEQRGISGHFGYSGYSGRISGDQIKTPEDNFGVYGDAFFGAFDYLDVINPTPIKKKKEY